MKLKALMKFKDKRTGEIYEAGTVLEVTEERAAEILENPLKLAEPVKTSRRRSASTGKRGAAK